MDSEQKILIQEITKLLIGGGAHVTFSDAIKEIKPETRDAKPAGIPYSIWQLVEHMRIAQWDMLQFCKDATHQSPKWPDDYWPKESGPDSWEAWTGAIQQIEDDLDEFIELVEHADLFQPLEHGDGQNVLREALQVADHNAYHIGEIIAIRRFLDDWK